MKGHPGGADHTLRMLDLAALPTGARILDMGAGAGDAVRIMREKGFQAEGIDLEPRSESVREGDMHRTGYPDGCFDAVLSQCSFFISGDPEAAVREAYRILKPRSLLLLSDVFFQEPELPGFQILHREDMTGTWREYYLEALWRDEDCGCPLPKGKCSYWLLIGKKEEDANGFV